MQFLWVIVGAVICGVEAKNVSLKLMEEKKLGKHSFIFTVTALGKEWDGRDLEVTLSRFSKTRTTGLCEDSDALLYIDTDTGNETCYAKGKQGPCGDRSVIGTNRNNSSLGICDCDFSNHQRMLVFDESTNACHFIFTQGFCEQGEWIALRDKPDPKGTNAYCEKNYCSRPNPASEWVPIKHGSQDCVELGSTENCPPGEAVRFFQGKVYPACNYTRKIPPKQTIGSVGVPPVKCQDGFVLAISGRCTPIFDFDL